MNNSKEKEELLELKRQLLKLEKQKRRYPIYGHSPSETASYLERLDRKSDANRSAHDYYDNQIVDVKRKLKDNGYDVDEIDKKLTEARIKYDRLPSSEKRRLFLSGMGIPSLKKVLIEGIDVDMLIKEYEWIYESSYLKYTLLDEAKWAFKTAELSPFDFETTKEYENAKAEYYKKAEEECRKIITEKNLLFAKMMNKEYRRSRDKMDILRCKYSNGEITKKEYDDFKPDYDKVREEYNRIVEEESERKGKSL